MKRTVEEHILLLERKLGLLEAELMNETSLENRNRIETEIRAANLALGHFRAALEVEQSLQSSQ
jgi:hypothetical protein